MPIYAYRCQRCGTEQDKLHTKSTDTKAPQCPDCKTEEHMQRAVTAPGGFDLKGSGWYSKGNH